jgi:hypothetical protein
MKEKHEFAIGNALLRTLGWDAKFRRHGEDGKEPDLIYTLNGQTLGIEIATAYYDNKQAEVEWQLARGRIQPDSSGYTKIGTWDEPDEKIAANVQRELNDKCAKRYSGVDLLWLCIEQHAPIATVEGTLQLVRRLTIPPGINFHKVYLGLHASIGDGGGFQVFDVLTRQKL